MDSAARLKRHARDTNGGRGHSIVSRQSVHAAFDELVNSANMDAVRSRF